MLTLGCAATSISIHALREEGDPDTLRCCCPTVYFYPRPPRGGRPVGQASSMFRSTISIHALREEGDIVRVKLDVLPEISIHALREEGDVKC